MSILRRSLTGVFFSSTLFISSLVFGQIDPDANGIGFYADLGGNANSLAAPIGLVDVYLLATNPTVLDVNCWGIQYRFDGPASFVALEFPYPTGTAQDPQGGLVVNVLINYPQGPGLPAQAATHLATLRLYLLDTTPVELYIMEIAHDGTPPFLLDNRLGTIEERYSWLRPSSGSYSEPVMRINGEAPIPDSRVVFGEVKALFR